jgi:hypothetical protein
MTWTDSDGNERTGRCAREYNGRLMQHYRVTLFDPEQIECKRRMALFGACVWDVTAQALAITGLANDDVIEITHIR